MDGRTPGRCYTIISHGEPEPQMSLKEEMDIINANLPIVRRSR